MAGELTVSVQAILANGPLASMFPQTQIRVDQAAKVIDDRVWLIGTTAEAINWGDVTTPGYVGLRNTDDTNFVQVGIDDGGVFIPLLKLLPGEVAIAPVQPGAAWHAKADTAEVGLRIWCVSR